MQATVDAKKWIRKLVVQKIYRIDKATNIEIGRFQNPCNRTF